MAQLKLNEYRLNSMEEPSDELLYELMEKVADAARESLHKAELEKQRRMEELSQRIEQRKIKNQVMGA